jgi:hypothetical protein
MATDRRDVSSQHAPNSGSASRTRSDAFSARADATESETTDGVSQRGEPSEFIGDNDPLTMMEADGTLVGTG